MRAWSRASIAFASANRKAGCEQALAHVSFARPIAPGRCDRGKELAVGERLYHEPVRSPRKRLAQGRVGAGTGDENDRKRGPDRSNLLQELEPGEAGHDDVADDEIDVGLDEQVERKLCGRSPCRS